MNLYSSVLKTHWKTTHRPSGKVALIIMLGNFKVSAVPLEVSINKYPPIEYPVKMYSFIKI
jgi:hypothetical protein